LRASFEPLRADPEPIAMTPDALRTAWMDFFAARGHTRVPSASLVPENDPTLLFTGAGMNPFKEYFLGRGKLPFRRACSVQKCFRQGDLENVGRTPRHLTFFEMLGHFSFGDYFKKEAIPWAYEFLTKVLALPADRLRVTVYEEDDEAHQVWLALGMPADRILRLDARENFWPADAPALGPNGPCGPCSEIFFDYGPEAEKGDGGPKGYDSGRFVEVWNTVFTQFDRREGGELVPLPQTNIDCGAGFERLVAALEGQQSPFGTRLFRPIVEAVAHLAGREYRFDPKGGQTPGEDARRMRRIAEHARASCFLIGDGVRPSNEGRGYVLRRVLRRAIGDGFQLGIEEPFLARLVDPVLAVMGDGYPTLREGRGALADTLGGEEMRFRETYTTGLRYLEEEVVRIGGRGTLPGAVAFRLHDTYGFPLDMAQLILAERGMDVDTEGFDREMEAQRDRARRGSKLKGEIFAGGPLARLREEGVPPTRFVGYERPGVRAEAAVVGIVRGEDLIEEAAAGEEVVVVLDQTPFYAEAGGQVGDAGRLERNGTVLEVRDAQGREGFTLHAARVVEGRLHTGDRVSAIVDAERRDAVRRNHTATHLLHLALKQVLGGHVRQEGSLVAPDRLRFDFRHDGPLTPEDLARIEERVNAWILRNDEVRTDVMELEAAKSSGAVSLFGEKYGDTVRVLSVASGSRELCGGTHCARTGDIGSFRVTEETGIAAGVRRLEAVTGFDAVAEAGRDRALVSRLSSLLKARPEEILARVEGLLEELKAQRKAAERQAKEAAQGAVKDLAARAESVAGLRLLAAPVPGADAKALKGAADTLKKDGVDAAALVGSHEGRAPVLAYVGPRALEKGLDARGLLQAMTRALGGGGGGSPAQAQGQGQDPGRTEAALAEARRVWLEALGAASS
jgi:alanyl-tRNA synthetase